MKAYAKQRYKEKRELIRLQQKEYYESHKKEFYERNKLHRKAFYNRHKNEPEFLEKMHAYHKKARERLKKLLVRKYSEGKMCCSKCGFNDIRALQIDHINGGGKKQKREINRRGGYQFYQWLKKENFPKGYQVLCANCNSIKRVMNHEYAESQR